ncbi:hypothetical protein AUC68_14800 [Methyloceanibacter methanicus]|uniref:Glucans biosynthesis protein G n=1 Tax=Methyloceanibacter methanicus TaxID=1774968 RepID=A0A1E3W5Y8_9HYPH|nr:glucan biosynthesis protein [Methyloceanibacter methanicus]ODS00527.1 hypothetical protein AUC68_14800 [Methyloceanibacter methanicus]
MNRREFLAAGGGSAFCAIAPCLGRQAYAEVPTRPFARDHVVERARELAEHAYEPPGRVTGPFGHLGYDQYRDIQFRLDRAIWSGEKRGFSLELLHAGFIYDTPVDVYLVEAGAVEPVRYDPSLFSFGHNDLPAHPGARLFSGIRLRYPINTPGYRDEVAVFQGGSYFRSLGEGQVYGVSARGLAIDTGEPHGEEFPLFRAFWVERPMRGARAVTVHALLDSPRVAGAFTFRIRPGHSTLMDVDATLFARAEIGHLGLAPLTSMYLFGSMERPRFPDYREAVHDSDALAIAEAGGDWVLRPLANPKSLQMSAFAANNLRGFGLQQRSNRFADFKDLEAKYELRPSVWVEPKDGWGRGAVELVEIPSDGEFNDNIVSFWRPARPLKPGSPLTYAYALRWGRPVTESGLARVEETHGGLTVDRSKNLFVVDFVAPLDVAAPGGRERADYFPDAIEPDVWASAGEITNVVGYPNTVTGGYRVSFELDTRSVALSELRLMLKHGDEVASETWLYRWTG